MKRVFGTLVVCGFLVASLASPASAEPVTKPNHKVAKVKKVKVKKPKKNANAKKVAQHKAPKRKVAA